MLNVSAHMAVAVPGCPAGLIRMLGSCGPQQRCAAAAILRHLSQCDANRQLMVKAGAMHALLEVGDMLHI